MPRNFPVVGVENDKQNEELPLLPFRVPGRCICLDGQIHYQTVIKIKIHRAAPVPRWPCASGFCKLRMGCDQISQKAEEWATEKPKVLRGFRVLFKGEKWFSAMNCPSFTSTPHDATLFYNYPCLHVGSLNHSCATAEVRFCQCGFRQCLCFYDSWFFRKLCHRWFSFWSSLAFLAHILNVSCWFQWILLCCVQYCDFR